MSSSSTYENSFTGPIVPYSLYKLLIKEMDRAAAAVVVVAVVVTTAAIAVIVLVIRIKHSKNSSTNDMNGELQEEMFPIQYHSILMASLVVTRTILGRCPDHLIRFRAGRIILKVKQNMLENPSRCHITIRFVPQDKTYAINSQIPYRTVH